MGAAAALLEWPYLLWDPWTLLERVIQAISYFLVTLLRDEGRPLGAVVMRLGGPVDLVDDANSDAASRLSSLFDIGR